MGAEAATQAATTPTPATAATTTAAPAAQPGAEPAATPAQPEAQTEQGGPKGQPNQEQQIARIVAEALKPIGERLAKLDGADPEAARQAVADTQADIDAINARHAEEAKRWAVERALLTAECIDTVGAMAHVDLDGVELADDGKRVQHWDGIRIEKLRDGALATNDIYAICFGLEEFHGITLTGDSGINVALPDWSAPGAVKSGDSEFVCGCALKKTKAAGVLHPKAATPAQG